MFGKRKDEDGPEGTTRTWSTPVVPDVAAAQLESVVDSIRVGAQQVSQIEGLHSNIDPEGLLGSLESLEMVQRVVDASRAKLLYSAHLADACNETGLTTARWLGDRAKLASGKARSRFQVTRVLFDGTLSPVINEALTAGVIGWSHVEVLAHVTNTRNQDQMAVLAPVHVERALVLAFNRWKQEIRVAAELFDADGPEPGNDDEGDNRLSFGASDKFTLLNGQLNAANAATVTEAIEAVTDELFRSRQRDAEATGGELEIPDRATLRAMALVEICRRATARKVGDTTPGRPEVSLSVGPDNFAHGVTRWGDTVTLADSVLFCAPDLVTILTDSDGNPKQMGPGFPFSIPPQPTGGFGLSGDQYKQLLEELEARVPDGWDRIKWQLNRGRAVRYATAEQRRALAGRDGGCVFPRCNMPHAWTDAHHLTWWRHGGTTDIHNLISLCRRHHGVAHTTGWNVTLDKHGWTHWTTPNGRHLHGQRHHTQPTPTGTNSRNHRQANSNGSGASQGSSVGGSGIVRSSDQCQSDQDDPSRHHWSGTGDRSHNKPSPRPSPQDKPPPGQPPGSPPGPPPGDHPPGTYPPCCGHD
ncbi:MAG: hypothetical protein WBF71_05215, partial [Microthrixaceae bacterium]